MPLARTVDERAHDLVDAGQPQRVPHRLRPRGLARVGHRVEASGTGRGEVRDELLARHPDLRTTEPEPDEPVGCMVQGEAQRGVRSGDAGLPRDVVDPAQHEAEVTLGYVNGPNPFQGTSSSATVREGTLMTFTAGALAFNPTATRVFVNGDSALILTRTATTITAVIPIHGIASAQGVSAVAKTSRQGAKLTSTTKPFRTSRPITPAPTTVSVRGKCSSSSISSLMKIRFPSKGMRWSSKRRTRPKFRIPP